MKDFSRLSLFKRLLLPLATMAPLLFALIGCSEKSGTASRRAASAQSATDSAVQVKERISSVELDGAPMRLNLFHVSYIESARIKFPIISYSLPAKADYVQLVRCRADANLYDLENVEIGAVNTEAADAKYKSNDYWKAISSNFACVVISSGVAIDRFVDYFANDGSWVYVGRACVQASRLPSDSSAVTLSPCSRQVSKTLELRGFINKSRAMTAEKKNQIIAQRDRADSIGRNLIYKAKQLDLEISRCESERGANRVSQIRRAAIGRLLGVGVGLGSKLIADPATQALTGGLDVGGIFRDLSAQAADFLPADFCPAADRLAAEIEIDRQQMEIEAEGYRQSLKLFGEPI